MVSGKKKIARTPRWKEFSSHVFCPAANHGHALLQIEYLQQLQPTFIYNMCLSRRENTIVHSLEGKYRNIAFINGYTSIIPTD